MKLYTEEQVIDIFEKYGNMSAINARNIIDLSESIELPSDEDIEEKFSIGTEEQKNNYLVNAFIQAQIFSAKWMRDKITNL